MEPQNKHFIYIIAVILFSLPSHTYSQGNVIEKEKPSKYVEITEEKPKLTFFQGFSISADLFPIGQKLLSDYGGFEGCLKLNLLNTYFPAVEAGYGICDHTDGNTQILYKTSAPYLRIGADYNLLKNKFQDNILYVGARYGLSKYNFDISGPALVDPIWGVSESFSNAGISTTSQWIEIVVGAQVKIYKGFHMGWAVRYKHEVHSSANDYASTFYIPGYGTTTGASCWGASYHLTFDLNWGKRRGRSVNIELKNKETVPPNTQPTDSISTEAN